MTAFMSLIPNASPALVERLGWTLVHFLWQGALIGLLSASLLAALHAARAHTRYLLACGSLLTLLAAPLFTFLLLAPQPPDASADANIATRANLATTADTATGGSGGFGANGVVAALATYARLVVGDIRDLWRPTVASDANSASTNDATRRDSEAVRRAGEAMRRGDEAIRRGSETMLRGGEAIQRDSEATWRRGEAIQRAGEAVRRNGEAMLLGGGTMVRGGGAGVMYRRALAAIDGALPWLVQAWTLGICLLSLRLAGGLALVAQWKRRRLQPASLELQQRLVALAQRLGVRRAIALRIAPGADTPAVIGWLRPVVLLPASALTGLAPAQLEAVLAHELAHVRRHDYIVNLLQSIAETLLFYHPAVWYVSHQIRVEREYCCDDDAIASCGDAMTYASALADLETLRHGVPAFAMTAVGSRDGRSSLLHRVRRLLTPASPSASPASAWPTHAALVATTIVVLSAFALRSSLAAAPQQQPPAPPTPPPSTVPSTPPSHGVDDLDIERQAPPAPPAPAAPAAPPEPVADAPEQATPAPPMQPESPEPARTTPTARASRPAAAVPPAPITPALAPVARAATPPTPRAVARVVLAPSVVTTPAAPAAASTVTLAPMWRAPRVTAVAPPAPAMPMASATIAPLPPAAVAPGATSPASRTPAVPVPPAAITPLPAAMSPRVTTVVPAAPAVAVTPAMAEPQIPAPPAAPAAPAAPAPPSEPPAPPVPPGNSGFHQEESSHDSTFTMQSNDDTTSLRVRGRGRIEFTDDDADVKSLSDGGYLEIEERTPSGTARVEFTSRAGSSGSTGTAGSPGSVERRWWKDGRSENFEPEGRAWVAKRLPDIIRRTGLATDTRVARILQRQGPNGVLDEVSRIPSDFVKSRYLMKLLALQSPSPSSSQKPLDAPVLTRLIVQTGREIKSDFARGQVLGAVAKLGVPPDDVAVAYIDATRTMHSDFERGRALGALVQAGRLHTATLKLLLDSATTIKSNFELSRLMLTTLEHQQLDETSQRAYLGAEGSIQSDFERRRVLTALSDARGGASKPLPESTIRGILEAVSHMHSAFDASQVLTRVAGTQRLDGDLRKLYIDTADKLSSRFERDRALAALAHNEHAERD